jgi:hypothetical protein
MSGPYRRLVVVLIRPSRYDDDGYVVRHWRGTLPSNTLGCLQSLTEDAARSGELGTRNVHVEVIDEIVTRVDPRAIGRRWRQDGTKIVVGLVGVQTNQFPRAQDLARLFVAQGLSVIIGGFHVSGAMAMASATPPECQAMLDAGVTLVLGEVEGRWGGILRDALGDRLQLLYNFLASPPDLTDCPLPRASQRTQRRFVLAHSGTIDAGRGCPFSCSFCTIVNVQGRTMRARSAVQILDQMRRNYHLAGRRGVHRYFFTDDNFSRNPNWAAIFDGLIRLREQEGAEIDFMMQVDTQAPRIPGFVEKAAHAGCVQVFIGTESVRDDNLKAGGKPQNRAADYREIIAKWHEVGVVCHVGFIIGFPNDTYRRVMQDVRTLREEIGVDQASFFMMTPIPGSDTERSRGGLGEIRPRTPVEGRSLTRRVPQVWSSLHAPPRRGVQRRRVGEHPAEPAGRGRAPGGLLDGHRRPHRPRGEGGRHRPRGPRFGLRRHLDARGPGGRLEGTENHRGSPRPGVFRAGHPDDPRREPAAGVRRGRARRRATSGRRGPVMAAPPTRQRGARP